MVIKIDIQGCNNCPFYDSEWGCNLVENGLAEDCPFVTDDEVIIKSEEKN